MLYIIKMKKFYLLITFTFLLIPVSVQAKIVSYVDENGQMRFVNTDFAKVPEKYREQVEPKTPDASAAEVENQNERPSAGPESDVPLTDSEQPLAKPADPVEVLTKSDCLDCRELQMLLAAHDIEYTTLDIEKSERAKTLYEYAGGGKLPITQIGKRTIYGVDVRTIVSIYHAARPGLPPRQEPTQEEIDNTIEEQTPDEPSPELDVPETITEDNE
jgi:glutaredoxin